MIIWANSHLWCHPVSICPIRRGLPRAHEGAAVPEDRPEPVTALAGDSRTGPALGNKKKERKRGEDCGVSDEADLDRDTLVPAELETIARTILKKEKTAEGLPVPVPTSYGATVLSTWSQHKQKASGGQIGQRDKTESRNKPIRG